jgi:hypothetical protein
MSNTGGSTESDHHVDLIIHFRFIDCSYEEEGTAKWISNVGG